MTIPSQKHILFHCVLSWGHNKPIVPFVAQIFQSRSDVIVSVLTSALTYPKLLAELDKLPPEVQADAKARFHIIDIAGTDVQPLVPLRAFEPVFKAMYGGDSVKCLSTGKTFTLPAPNIAIIDPFAGYAIEAIRETTKNKMPIFMWATFTAGSVLTMFSKAASEKLDVQTLRYGTEEDVMALQSQLGEPVTDEVISFPGVPPMYGYEYYPQGIPISGNIFIETGRKYMTSCNGMILASSSAYEGKSIDVLKERFTSLGQAIYTVGPLSLPDPPSGEKGKQVVEFLDKMHAKYGEKSVIYMSFGTVFWPANPEKIWAAIEEILASGTPLVWAHPSPFCQIPDDKLKMFQDSEIAFETQWAPQEAILSHPATGWFISHGGWNSTQEAMLYRVPQIFWPQYADQPQNAATVVINHKAGFELIEVRTGEHGTGKPYRFKDADPKDLPTFTVEAVRREIRDVLKKSKSDEGLMVRKNYEQLSKKVYSGWDEGGEARKNFDLFLEQVVGHY
ncbi:UDP-Glycosyltransferase/glycogen phosphorylase [Dendrothele bispora CBS 962.96]|uniref:UDP-Glycosyltransferase/glycogen phosphorylase n=1 Tax=Dendrothele bispora (strain CBS 962.96) TaxID=1314807 RepID=A0A4S8L6T1_DENBC|nr:UDP-Glycosyltransferase/glycogen phosphorylase [Dendrothele bispora CBS 962.96]